MAETRVRCDVNGIMREIQQLGDRAVRGISNEMANFAEIMLHDAILNAPRDTGSLEDSLEVEYERSGINGRLVVRIGVDESAAYVNSAPNHKPSDKAVGDYAELIEQGLSPYGSGDYQAGAGTLGKGRQAGGLFLTRAVNKHKAALYARARQIAKQAVKRG